jgi:hypothetical protein
VTEPERLPPPPFWRTRYFALSVMARPDRRMIDPIMIISVLNAPFRKEREPSGRFRRWGYISELGHWLRVVTLEDGQTVHNAMLDRDFQP